MPMNTGQFGLPQLDVPQPAAPKKGGMFGAGKADIGQAIQAALYGALAARGNPAGMMGLQMLQQKRQQALEGQRYQQRREDSFQDAIRLAAWKQANQGPDDLTIMMQQVGIDPNSEQGQAFRLQALQNKINPFVAITQQNPDGSESRQFIRPPMMGQGMPPIGTEVDDPRKQGGPTLGGSGGFPRSY